MKFKTALVLAGGAFGTAIGFVLTQNFEKVIVMVRSKEIYDEINRGENSTYLPGGELLSMTFDHHANLLIINQGPSKNMNLRRPEIVKFDEVLFNSFHSSLCELILYRMETMQE